MAKEPKGYVYKITNEINGKWYIGSHNGNDPRYYSSGLLVKYAIEKHGKENLSREIIMFTDNYREEEEKLLMELDAANDPMSYNLHNGGTGGRPGSTHTEEHKEWLRERFSGEGNPIYGKPVPDEVRKKLSEALKGREFSEETIKKMKEARKGEKHPYYGKTFPDEWKANLSKALSGKNNPNYGVKMSDEQKKKLSIANSGENHPMYGKEITDEHRANLSKAMMGKNNPMYGKKHSNEHREKIGKANLEVKQKITECPHCGKSGGYRLLTRFHFDNCKFKSRIKIEVEDGKEFFTVQELVKLFSTSRNSIFRLIDNGMIEAIKVPPYQAFHIPVDKFIKKFGLK